MKILTGTLFLLTVTILSLYLWLQGADRLAVTGGSQPLAALRPPPSAPVPERRQGAALIGQEEPDTASEPAQPEQPISRPEPPSPVWNPAAGIEISIPAGAHLPLGLMEVEEILPHGMEKNVILDEFLKALPVRFAKEVSDLEGECRRAGAPESEYRRRWQEATHRYDEQLHSLLGGDAYLSTCLRNNARNLDTLLLKKKN